MGKLAARVGFEVRAGLRPPDIDTVCKRLLMMCFAGSPHADFGPEETQDAQRRARDARGWIGVWSGHCPQEETRSAKISVLRSSSTISRSRSEPAPSSSALAWADSGGLCLSCLFRVLGTSPTANFTDYKLQVRSPELTSSKLVISVGT